MKTHHIHWLAFGGGLVVGVLFAAFTGLPPIGKLGPPAVGAGPASGN
jgi:hypothetical protein